MRTLALIILLVFGSGPAAADGPADALRTAVEAALAQGPAGTRYGLMVTTLEGETLFEKAADERFIAASNTKMFITAAGYAHLAALERALPGTAVRLAPGRAGAPDVILHGRGDAALRSGAGCVATCLEALADAVAARTRLVGDIAGDDSWFPTEPWGQGMSWNNILFRYGTGISALTLDDNELSITVSPGRPGGVATVTSDGYFEIDNRIITMSGAGEAIQTTRAPNSRLLRLTGTLGADAAPVVMHFGIDDPAHFAAWRMGELLRARGVRVMGEIGVRHRALGPQDDPAIRAGAPAPRPPVPDMLAVLPASSVAADMTIINKTSQNLHAELLLRRLGRLEGGGSVADGQAVVRKLMAAAGVDIGSVTLADGSGMSSYNRITPRAATALLAWIARQPWGLAWRETLPIAGRDGTLGRRFKASRLEGQLFAKTGSLNAARALSGYLVAGSGRVLVFSALANDMPDGADAAASAAVDRALLVLAEAL